jgi:D-arabinose 1-dehydrogenase-like Zn-dependent alcohol dehydrogenase
MDIAKKFNLKVRITPFLLEDANQALAAIRNGAIEGSVVLRMSGAGWHPFNSFSPTHTK